MSDWDRRIPRCEEDIPDLGKFWVICTLVGVVGAILLLIFCPTC